MHLVSGSVRELAGQLSTSEQRAQLVDACVTQYRNRYGRAPGDGERYSWHNSWPQLLPALCQAGLGDLHLFLEFEMPASSERADAVLLGTKSDGGLAAVVIELKQWTTIEDTTSTRTMVNGSEYTHPCAQAAGYVGYLRDWLDADHLGLEIRGIAVLHNAGQDVATRLRTAVSDKASGEIGIVCAPDLARPDTELAKVLLAEDLQPPTAEVVHEFLNVEHRPSERLLGRLADVVAGDRVFDLVGAQQDAYLTVLDKIAKAREGGRHLIVVTGGPGTGKSVIALRLLAAIPQDGIKARYVTPSGTLRRQLLRAVEEARASGLFVFLADHVAHPPTFPQVSLVDEAQRMKCSENYVERLMSITRLCVLFLDERQIIRPDEGLTLAECQDKAVQLGATPHHVELTAQFRCGGSLEYLTWLEELLYAQEPARPDSTPAYDIGLAQNPEDLASWVEEHTNNGHTARITAGFCWKWPRISPSRPLNNDVTITWTDTNGQQKTWRRPWNASNKRVAGGAVIAPQKEFWATDEGGHNQVGCIYTCQGLEYDYAGVILGPDFVRRDGEWVGRPDHSEDPVMKRGVSPADYTRLAANIYYVLASRGTQGCRLFSTDEETQHYLATLLASRAI